jgi:uncharacterized protein (DUF1800 family)
MLPPFTSAIAANRFGLGARPDDLAHIGGDPVGWLRAQLESTPPAVVGDGLRSSADVIAQSLDVRREIRAARQSAKGGDEAALQAVLKLPQLYRPIYIAEATARFRQAATTDRPFLERITQFWTNHFAVSVDKVAVLGVAGSLEREAIRPRVLGNFTDLLLAVEQHPAMLLYLDNFLSVGPHSSAAGFLERRNSQRHVGINENLAREIMELHTLGVGSGYTQTDVTTFAEVITGWSISGDEPSFAPQARLRRWPRGSIGPAAGAAPGKFLFRPELHEPGAKAVLGKRYTDAGIAQGEAVLRDIAAKPATAHFIATKLCRHFIADDPSPAVVDHVARAFASSHGDLRTVYHALLTAPEAWAQPLSKYKTPSDFIVSTFRGLQLPVGDGRGSIAAFEVMGQRTYSPGSPAGWPDRGDDWNGASALMKRIEWADAVGQRVGARRDAADLAPQLLGETLSANTRTAISRAASGAQAVTLLLAAPEFMRR